MNIYRGKTHDGETIGIVLAETEKIAHAYFVGRGEIPHSMDVVDPTDSRLGVLGLVTLFKTKVINTRDFSDRIGGREIRTEDRS